MTEPSNQAERFHRARVEFVEAMEAGCSILELRRRKADARARLRQRAQAEVTERTARMVQAGAPFAAETEQSSPYWWKRD